MNSLAMRTGLVALAAVTLGGLVIFVLQPTAILPRSDERTLQSTMDDVSRRWPAVDQASSEAVAGLLESGNVALFDVREQAEFDVSHLPGAVRIDPETPPEVFLDRYGAAASGKTIVFYCSVGMRSTGFTDRVSTPLAARGARVLNLEGGIFRWHGEKRALVDARGPTDDVHPYDSAWGRLVERQAFTRTHPRR